MAEEKNNNNDKVEKVNYKILTSEVFLKEAKTETKEVVQKEPPRVKPEIVEKISQEVKEELKPKEVGRISIKKEEGSEISGVFLPGKEEKEDLSARPQETSLPSSFVPQQETPQVSVQYKFHEGLISKRDESSIRQKILESFRRPESPEISKPSLLPSHFFKFIIGGFFLFALIFLVIFLKPHQKIFGLLPFNKTKQEKKTTTTSVVLLFPTLTTTTTSTAETGLPPSTSTQPTSTATTTSILTSTTSSLAISGVSTPTPALTTPSSISTKTTSSLIVSVSSTLPPTTSATITPITTPTSTISQVSTVTRPFSTPTITSTIKTTTSPTKTAQIIFSTSTMTTKTSQTIGTSTIAQLQTSAPQIQTTTTKTADIIKTTSTITSSISLTRSTTTKTTSTLPSPTTSTPQPSLSYPQPSKELKLPDYFGSENIKLKALTQQDFESALTSFLNRQEPFGTIKNVKFTYENQKIAYNFLFYHFFKSDTIKFQDLENNLTGNYAFVVYYGYTRKYPLIIFEVKNPNKAQEFNKKWEKQNMANDLRTLFLGLNPGKINQSFVSRNYLGYSYRILDIGNNFKIIWSVVDNYLVYSTTERGLKDIIDNLKYEY